MHHALIGGAEIAWFLVTFRLMKSEKVAARQTNMHVRVASLSS